MSLTPLMQRLAFVNKQPKYLKLQKDLFVLVRKRNFKKSNYVVLDLKQAFSLQMCSDWSLVSPKKKIPSSNNAVIYFRCCHLISYGIKKLYYINP